MKSILSGPGNPLRPLSGMHRNPLALASICVLIVASSAIAIHPGRWVHSTEADFDSGKKQNTVVTNHGEIKLSAASRILSRMPDKTDVIYDVQPVKNGRVYLAAGPETKLLIYQPNRPRAKGNKKAKPAPKPNAKAKPKAPEKPNKKPDKKPDKKADKKADNKDDKAGKTDKAKTPQKPADKPAAKPNPGPPDPMPFLWCLN